MAALRLTPGEFRKATFRPSPARKATFLPFGGSALSAACLAVLSVWRFADGSPGWAAVFAGLALLQLGFALRGSGPAPAGRAAADPARRNWVRIAVANLALAVAAVFWFPPLALVLAALGLYSAHRARRPVAPG